MEMVRIHMLVNGGEGDSGDNEELWYQSDEAVEEAWIRSRGVEL